MNRVLLAAVVSGVALSAASADQILQINSNSLTTYLPSAASAAQSIRPRHLHRAVGIDGVLRSSGGAATAIAGNPYPDAPIGSSRIGDVNLATGGYEPVFTFWRGAALVPWPVTYSYNGLQETSGAAHRDSDAMMGFNGFYGGQREIVLHDDADNTKDTLYLLLGASQYVEFVRTGSSSTEYRSHNGAAGIFQKPLPAFGQPTIWILTLANGNKEYYFGNDTSSNRANWQLWKVENAAGDVAYAGHATNAATAASTGYNSDKTLSVAYDSAGRRLTHSYTTVGSVSRLSQVLIEIDDGDSTWETAGTETLVGQVDLSYYTTTDSGKGLTGDLKLVTVTTPLTDSGVSWSEKYNFRWYTSSWANSDGNRGEPHQIKMVVRGAGYNAFDATDGSMDDDPLAESDANLKPYADVYLEYVGASDYRVSTVMANGECGCAGGSGVGTHELTYGTNGSFSGTSGYDTTWYAWTLDEMPDGIFAKHFYDETGSKLSTVVTDADPSGSPTDMWVTEVVRDSLGCVTAVHSPANNASYTNSTGAFTRNASSGLVREYERESTGDLTGFLKAVKFKEGNTGTAYYESFTTLSDRDFQVATGVHVTRPQIDARRVYHTAGSSSGTTANYNETSYTHTFWSGTNTNVLYLAPKQITTTLPVVTTAQNGSNAADTSKVYLRQNGTTAFMENAIGIFNYMQFSQAKLTKSIQDVSTNGSFPSGDDPNTDWGITESGTHSDRTTEYTYDNQDRVTRRLDPDGRDHFNYYSRLKDHRPLTISFPRRTTSGTTTYYGPASYTVTNQARKSVFSGLIAISDSGNTTALTGWIDETDADPITALDQGTLARMSTSICSNTGHRVTESRSYFSIPASGAGTEGINYDAVKYGYDDMGRRWRVKDATGTITRTKFDDLGRPYESWLGTNDNSFSGGEASGTDNMVKTHSMVYDSGNDGGNSHMTSRTAYVQDSTTNKRVTEYLYDLRGRVIVTRNGESGGYMAPHTVDLCDNMGRVVASGVYSSESGLSASTDPTSTATNRKALSRSYFDPLGRVYETRQYQINQSTGAIVQVTSVDQYIPSLTWYDPVGRVMQVRGREYSKNRYDRLGRQTHKFLLAKTNDTDYAHASNSTAIWDSTNKKTNLAGDFVVEEHQTAYESEDSDNVVLSVVTKRHHSDVYSGTTGELDTNADGDPLIVTAANVKGWTQLNPRWYDDLDRVTDSVLLGTNGIVGDGSTTTGTYNRGTAGSPPARSATALRATTTYNTDGTVLEVADPKNLKTRWSYDALGRKTAEIRNYVNGTPSSETGDDDTHTRFVYTEGHMTKMWVDFDGDNVEDTTAPKDQVTEYVYGVTKGASAGDSKISSDQLLWKVIYPEGDTSTTLATRTVVHAYNAQGQNIYTQDQAGTVIENDYDILGRQTQRRATTLASGVDTRVRRIMNEFDSRGNLDKVSQYDNATVGSGSILDQVQYTWGEWNELKKFEQDVDSAIGVSGRASFYVSYNYAKTSNNGRHTLRRSSQSSSFGLSQSYTYDSSSNWMDADLSRVTGSLYFGYQYIGLADLVGTNCFEPGTFSQLQSGTYSYSGMDQFGRDVESKWTKDHATDVTFYDVDITYDENSNITSVVDNIQKDASNTNRLYDVKYSVDGLNRVSQAEEGQYASGSISGRTRNQSWVITQANSLSQDSVDLNGDNDYSDNPAIEWQDTRTHTTVNELTQRALNTNGISGAETTYTLTYSAGGNLTDDGKDCTYVYDFLNRLTEIKTRGGSPTTVAKYQYNGRGHRTGEFIQSWANAASDSNLWYWSCYDERWREVGVFRKDDADPKVRYLYFFAGIDGTGGSSYIDSVAYRDFDRDTNYYTAAADGTLEERRYYCQNWRADVSAIVTDTGKMVESVKYSASGIPTGIPVGDTDADGDYDATDETKQGSDVGGTNVRSDSDHSGTVAAADVTHAKSVTGGYQTLGRAVLSSTAILNTRGYCGYPTGAHDSDLHMVRARVRRSSAILWMQRDPLGYIDGINVYSYVNANPISLRDPSGTTSTGCRGCSNDNGRAQQNNPDPSGVSCLQLPTYGACLTCCNKLTDPIQRQFCVNGCALAFPNSTYNQLVACFVEYRATLDQCYRQDQDCQREASTPAERLRCAQTYRRCTTNAADDLLWCMGDYVLDPSFGGETPCHLIPNITSGDCLSCALARFERQMLTCDSDLRRDLGACDDNVRCQLRALETWRTCRDQASADMSQTVFECMQLPAWINPGDPVPGPGLVPPGTPNHDK